MGWTVQEVLKWTTAHFRRRHIQTARLDAEVLLAHTLGVTRVQLYTSFDQPLTPHELAAFRERVKRRAAREPVAYITGRKAFWTIDLEVGAGALIPRPDTETLVEHAIKLLTGRARPARDMPRRSLPWSPDDAQALAPASETLSDGRNADGRTADGRTEDGRTADGRPADGRPADSAEADAGETSSHEGGQAPDHDGPTTAQEHATPALILDLCTGVGNIPICLALETGCRAIGVDISPEAVRYARNNVASHGLETQVAILLGDLTAPVPRRFEGRFQLITANPPYLTPAMYAETAPEIAHYEPREALLAGDDGLEVCRRILDQAPRWLGPGGSLLIEIGTEEQARALLDSMAEKGFEAGRSLPDLSGNARVVVARKPGAPAENP